jgi:hypothetical protein
MKQIPLEPYRSVLNRIDQRPKKHSSSDSSDPEVNQQEEESERDFYRRLEDFRESDEFADDEAP